MSDSPDYLAVWKHSVDLISALWWIVEAVEEYIHPSSWSSPWDYPPDLTAERKDLLRALRRVYELLNEEQFPEIMTAWGRYRERWTIVDSDDGTDREYTDFIAQPHGRYILNIHRLKKTIRKSLADIARRLEDEKANDWSDWAQASIKVLLSAQDLIAEEPTMQEYFLQQALSDDSGKMVETYETTRPISALAPVANENAGVQQANSIQKADYPPADNISESDGSPDNKAGVRIQAACDGEEAPYHPDTPPGPQRDPETEARDKWIYEQCSSGKAYRKIIVQLRKMADKWDLIGSISGIKKAANSYATRHGLPMLSPRQSGRPKR